MNSPVHERDAHFSGLLDELRAGGHLAAEVPDNVPVHSDEADVSRWILALQAMGGWLASIFLLSFVGLGASALMKSGTGWLVLGILTTVLAGSMLQKAGSVFLRQFLLPFSLAGQVAFAMGAVQLGKDGGWWLVAAFQLAVCILVAWPMHRFLAALSVLYALQAALLGDLFFHGDRSWLGSWLVPLYWAAACALLLDEAESMHWRVRKFAPVIAAFAAALVVHVLASIALPLAVELGGNGWMSQRSSPGLSQMAVSVVSFVCLGYLGMPLWRTPRGALLLAALAAVLAVCWQSPGVGIGVAAMALGFAGGRRWLLWLGGLVALAAIGRFYYFLQVNLLTKSGFLILGGSLLLAMRVLIGKGEADAT